MTVFFFFFVFLGIRVTTGDVRSSKRTKKSHSNSDNDGQKIDDEKILEEDTESEKDFDDDYDEDDEKKYVSSDNEDAKLAVKEKPKKEISQRSDSVKINEIVKVEEDIPS